MYIFAETTPDRPLEAMAPLLTCMNLGDRTWYLALMEMTLDHTVAETRRVHISGDCVGVTILNGRCTGLLRIVDIEARVNKNCPVYRDSIEYVNPYPIKVNQPVLTTIRITLSSPDNEDLSVIKGFSCVLHLSDDE